MIFTSEAVAEILIGDREGKEPLHYNVEDGVVVSVSGWQKKKSGIKTTDPSEKDRIGVLERSNERLKKRLLNIEPRLRRAIGFLESAVKCGEPWTDEAQAIRDDAIDALVGSTTK